MSEPFIIAEAAQGYLPLVGDRGSLDLALLLTRAAARAGADAVKFQIVYVDELAQKGNVHYDIFRRLEMPEQDWATVRAFAEAEGVAFQADVFGSRSLGVADRIGVDGVKVHSTSFFDHDLVGGALALGCEVYFSVGGIEIDEVGAFIERHGLRERSDVALLYGFQAEPTPLEENHLARIPELRARTGLPVGFMDHSAGDGPDTSTLSLVALGLGVTLFEKHVTLDRALELEDYVSALAPGALATFVEAMRAAWVALGSSDLELRPSERVYRNKALKRVVARRDLPAGSTLAPEDIELIRPVAAAGAWDLEHVVGRDLARDVVRGGVIDLDDLR